MSTETLSPDKWGAGRLEGFRKWDGFDPFEEHTGPFYFRETEPGRYLCAFEALGQHVNGSGAIHGGCLMTFADFALFVISKPALQDGMGVTVSMNSEFIGAGLEQDFVQATGEIVRETGSLVFARGLVFSARAGETDPVMLLNFSGIVKKIRPR